MGIRPEICVILGAQTSNSGNLGSRVEPKYQEVKYQIENWNSLDKRWGYCTLLREKELCRGILYDV